jgi:hypothetical protein
MARVEQAFFDRTQSMNNYGNYVTADVPYFVFDALDEDDAVLAVHGYSSEWFSGLRRDAVEVEERINEDTFKVIVRYQQHNTTDDGDDPETVYTFDTGGGTQHITQSISTRNRYPASAPDYEGAVGYDGENVAGVDIIQPVYNFTETHFLPRTTVTETFRARLARKTGMYNNDAFRGFDPGEVLFLGASGVRRGDGREDLWEITYRFAVSQNRSSFTVGGISVATKLGWDYMWVRYADEVDDTVKQVVKKPVAVYIEKVYYGTNFGSLGI